MHTAPGAKHKWFSGVFVARITALLGYDESVEFGEARFPIVTTVILVWIRHALCAADVSLCFWAAVLSDARGYIQTD